MQKIAYVGVDYHQTFLAVVVLPEGGEGPVQKVRLENNPKTIRKYMDKLSGQYEIKACYEASSCGYVFHRQMQEWKYSCQVVVPSKIPRKAGDRVKTDFKDAENLAYQLRNGSLSFVHVPTEEQEAVRAFLRCRTALKEDSKRVKMRINSLLQAQGLGYSGTKWTQGHAKWLDGVKLPQYLAAVLYEYRLQLEIIDKRLKSLDEEIVRLSEKEPYAEPVRALHVLRGIGTLSAMILLSEIADFKRFASPKALMSFLGFTPSEYSSGGVRKYGGITKAGNGACRRVLIESVQHYRKRPAITVKLREKWKGQPARRVEMAARCMKRLHDRYWRLEKRKPKNVALVAVAREFVGFIWSLMQPEALAHRA